MASSKLKGIEDAAAAAPEPPPVVDPPPESTTADEDRATRETERRAFEGTDRFLWLGKPCEDAHLLLILGLMTPRVKARAPAHFASEHRSKDSEVQRPLSITQAGYKTIPST